MARPGHRDEVKQKTLELVGRLKDVKWDWSEPGLDSLLTSLGTAPEDAVPGRRTYAFPSGQRLSVYAEDGRVEFLEATFEAFFDPHRLSPEAYEDKVDEYFSKYEEAVAAAEHVLGPPVFNDGGGAQGFPEDQEAVWLAQWNLPTARLMIQQKHEDKELPFRICLVVTPHLEKS
jgi:hypothetical protein